MSSLQSKKIQTLRLNGLRPLKGALVAILIGSVGCKNFNLAKQNNFRAKTSDGYVYILPVPDHSQGSGTTGKVNWVEIHTQGSLSDNDLKAVYRGNISPDATRLTRCPLSLAAFNSALSSDAGVAPQTRSAFFASMALVAALASGVATGEIVSTGMVVNKAELSRASKELEFAKLNEKSAVTAKSFTANEVSYRVERAAQVEKQLAETQENYSNISKKIEDASKQFQVHQDHIATAEAAIQDLEKDGPASVHSKLAQPRADFDSALLNHKSNLKSFYRDVTNPNTGVYRGFELFKKKWLGGKYESKFFDEAVNEFYQYLLTTDLKRYKVTNKGLQNPNLHGQILEQVKADPTYIYLEVSRLKLVEKEDALIALRSQFEEEAAKVAVQIEAHKGVREDKASKLGQLQKDLERWEKASEEMTSSLSSLETERAKWKGLTAEAVASQELSKNKVAAVGKSSEELAQNLKLKQEAAQDIGKICKNGLKGAEKGLAVCTAGLVFSVAAGVLGIQQLATLRDDPEKSKTLAMAATAGSSIVDLSGPEELESIKRVIATAAQASPCRE